MPDAKDQELHRTRDGGSVKYELVSSESGGAFGNFAEHRELADRSGELRRGVEMGREPECLTWSGMGCADVSGTPVVEWSGCGSVFKAPVVVVRRDVAAVPRSPVSCTWINVPNVVAVQEAAVALEPENLGDLRPSYVTVMFSHVLFTLCS